MQHNITHTSIFTCWSAPTSPDDLVTTPEVELPLGCHHHLYVLCKPEFCYEIFCAVIYSRSVAVQSKPCGTYPPVYGVNLARPRTDPSKRLVLCSYFIERKAKCQLVDRNLQKLAATTNYVSKTDPPLLLLIRFNPGGNRRKFANCQKSDTQIPTAARKKCGFVDFARCKLPSPPLSRLAGVYECWQCLLVIGMRQKQTLQDSQNDFYISCDNHLAALQSGP